MKTRIKLINSRNPIKTFLLYKIIKAQTVCIFLLFPFFIFGQNANADYVNELRVLYQNDQKYRNQDVKASMDKNEWKKAALEMDRKCREKLDKLFYQYGFPKSNKVGDEGVMTALLILHHSEDCKWNNRWVKIVLDNYQEIDKYKNLMKFMLERTYGSEFGICQESAKEIYALVKSYGNQIANELGIQ